MIKDTQNIYKIARTRAGLKRDPAAEELHVPVRSLDNYEALDGSPPDDIVDRMCILYDYKYLSYASLSQQIRRGESQG